MATVNRYYRFSKISEQKFRHLLRCFADDLTATETAKLTRLSKRSVNAIFLRMRSKIAQKRKSWWGSNREISRTILTFESMLYVYYDDEGAEGGYTSSRFWPYASGRLKKFNGLPAHTQRLHLRETEFRYVHHEHNLYKVLLAFFRKNPL
jgi:transposase-like protein